MKARHSMQAIVLPITFSLVLFLTGCVNRFQDYEPPISTFDEKMAAYEQGGPIPTDEQMTMGPDDPYANYSGGDAVWDEQPQSNYQPRVTHRRSYSSSSGSGGSGGDLEVPFDNSRGPKHPANIGAL